MEHFHFDSRMLSIARWEPVVDPTYLSKITFWVRVMGVPLHFWAEPTFRRIGSALGEVQGDIDLDEGRFRVVMDGFKPLVFSSRVEFYTGEETKVALRYEKLHGLCRLCNSLRHDQSRCLTQEESKNGGDGDFPHKPDNGNQGSKAPSYKDAVTRDQEQGYDRRDRRNERGSSYGSYPKDDVKGKGIAECQEGLFRQDKDAYKPRRER